MSWARRLERVFDIDVGRGECGGKLKYNNGSAAEPERSLGLRLRVAVQLRRNDAARDDVGFNKSSRERNFRRTAWRTARD
jgi:hypothetical protein